MKSRSSFISALKSSPLLVTFGVAAIVVFGSLFVQYARRGGFWSPKVEARVFTRDRSGKGDRRDANGQRPFVFQGEVYSDATRLQEASAIALAGMLVAANRSMENRSLPNVESLLNEMFATEVVPP